MPVKQATKLAFLSLAERSSIDNPNHSHQMFFPVSRSCTDNVFRLIPTVRLVVRLCRLRFVTHVTNRRLCVILRYLMPLLLAQSSINKADLTLIATRLLQFGEKKYGAHVDIKTRA